MTLSQISTNRNLQLYNHTAFIYYYSVIVNDSMTPEYKMQRIMSQHGGIATTAQIEAAGVNRVHIKGLVANGNIVRERHGVYTLPDFVEDDMVRLQSKYLKGVFSLGTALWLHKITDRTPIRYSLTFPRGYHTVSLKDENIDRVFAKKELWGLGIVEVKNGFGDVVRTYDMEKTICDVLRKYGSLDIQLITDALRQFVARRNKNLNRLSHYASLLRVEKPLRRYLEVLL